MTSASSQDSLAEVQEKQRQLSEVHDEEQYESHEYGLNTNAEDVTQIPKEDYLSRISSRRSASSFIDPGPPPDGGLKAWTQVFMVHLVIFVTWGYVNSFGVFESYYIDALNRPRSDIAWIGSIQIFLLFFIATFAGRALDYGLFRVVFITGMILQLLGTFMTSLSTKYWQIFLAQGLCTGIGEGLMFCPSMALVSTYFSKRKVIAIAIASCGSSTGGLVFPAIVKQLLPRVGFPWTVRVVGFLMLGINLVALATLRTRVPPRKSGSIIDWSAFKEPTYTLYIVGMFFAFWAVYFAFFFIGSFASDIVKLSYSNSINLIFILNGVGLPARVIPALIADRITGPMNFIIPLIIGSGIVMYGWSGVTTVGGLYGWAIVYALVSNGIQALWPATLSCLTKDPTKAGTRIGMGFTIVSFACLTGPPLSGALIQQDSGQYLYAQMWAGSSFLLGGIICLVARFVHTGKKLRVRI